MVQETYFVLLLICICNDLTWGQSPGFTFPELELTALSPKGFRAELPDQPGIELFSFHGKLNDKLEGSREGDITGEINSPTNGKWTFEDPDLELNIGDNIYYWIYVQYNRGGYTKRDLSWEVTTRATGANCADSNTVASGTDKAICGGNIIFEDNFNEPNINKNKWIIQKYIPSISEDDHYEFVSYQDRNDNRFIRNSVLYLKPTAAASRTEITGQLDLSQGCTRSKDISCKYSQVGGYILPPVVSAKLLSKMSFRYGKVEIRAKVPIGDWIYPQIELIPKNRLPSYPKILIAYTRGNLNLTYNNNDDIGNTLLFGGPTSTSQEPERSKNLKSYRSPTPLGRDMRTYTLTWGQSRIDLTIDSNLYGTIFSNEYTGFNTEYQISLGVGVGGNYDFPDDTRSGNFQKPWKNFEPRTMKDFYDQKNFWSTTWKGNDVALQVDSVKVWAV